MKEQEENKIEENTIMEELKIHDDEHVKELSIEDDILGAQSLLMSESDEDDKDNCVFKIQHSPQKSPKLRKPILDSDDNERKEPSAPANQEDAFTMNKKKISGLVDSEVDLDRQDSSDEEHSKKLSIELYGDAKAYEIAKVNLKPLKEDHLNLKLNKNLKQKSENNNINSLQRTRPESNSGCPERSQKSKTIEVSKLEEHSDTEGAIGTKKSKRLSLIDSESSDAESEKGINVSDLEVSARQANFEEDSSEKNKLKVVRASAKKAMDEMQAIQSEQQRLHREAHISIPCHKPRKHTLDEFLMRRMIIQPQKSSPIAAAIQQRSLKMTTEELEEYAKLMEERAKEATEFFKSESENEEDERLKDNEGAIEKQQGAKSTKENVMNIAELPLYFPIEAAMHAGSDGHAKVTGDLTQNPDSVKLTEDELTKLLAEEEQIPQLEKEQERPTCSKVSITEIIELPKLDMNTVQISPLRKITPRSSLNVKQLLGSKQLSESPSLTGDPNKLIDLETGDLIDKNPTGIENLMKRLMSTVKAKKVKNSETCTILSVENGKLEMSNVNISRRDANDVQKETKPGAAYFELKRNLKEIIKKKRLEEMNKKQEDELEYSKCLADDDDDYDDKKEDEMEEMYAEEYEPDDKIKTKVLTVDEEENATVGKDDGDEVSVDEEDSEYEAYDADEDDEDEEENENYNNAESLDKSQRKNRIIKAFDDTDEEGENDDIDFLKTQPPTTQASLLETQASVKISLEDEQRELMELCSGSFDETQKTSLNALMSQIPITQNSNKQVNDEELMQLCSGTFEQPSASLQTSQFQKISDKLKTKCNKILSSDEESNDSEQLHKNEINNGKLRKLTKKLKKRKPKLGFSDDEDDEKDEEDYEDGKEEEVDYHNLEITAEESDTFVDYDSEENEIFVKMTKDDKIKQAQNFFEKEAELSESEWGSADEDENNLDKYDIELGDEDEFDRQKLQTELGKIHARKMLDEDIREVRKIKEMLFEDEEKDGVGRQRTFKWKNAESGFSLDDGRPLDETDDGQNVDSGDEINERQWRKIRHEREQFLQEQGFKPDSQDISTVLPNATTPLNSTETITVTTKKLQIISAKKTALSTSDTKKGSPFLISKDISAMNKKSVRGSFLVRDKETLNKLAGLTKATSSSIAVSDMDDTAGTVSIKSIKPKNFVFATLTEEEHETLKRKADDLLNSSNENGKNFMKKTKIEPRRDKCLIDQLL